ncbi:MAG: hypothetical protein JO166_07835 [Deltaproteobacteria bacterium]|nr:hypothetical protein [Deltaproteobacteria bacterium]
MPILNMNELGNSEKFDLLPLGRYPAKLKIETYQRDQSGRLVMGKNGKNDKPIGLTTKDGAEKWNLTWILLDSEQVGRKVFDSLSFSPRGARRAKDMLVIQGIIKGDEEHFDLQPEMLANSFWFIKPHHEISVGPNGVKPESKQPFDPGNCSCAVCVKAAGTNVFVKARIGWSDFEKMSEAEAEEYAKNATPFD